MGKKRQRNEEMQSKDGDGSRGKPKLSKLQQKMSRSLSGAQVLLCHGSCNSLSLSLSLGVSFYLSTLHVRG